MITLATGQGGIGCTVGISAEGGQLTRSVKSPSAKGTKVLGNIMFGPSSSTVNKT